MKNNTRQALFTLITVALVQIELFAAGEEKQDHYNIIPIAAYNYIESGDVSVHSPGAAVAVQNQKNLFVGAYTCTALPEKPYYTDTTLFHSIDFLGDIQDERNQYLLIFKSDSDKPVSGGIHTFALGAAYGYKFVKGSKFSLTAGAGVAVGDFGIDLPNGNPLPVIPVPLLRITSTHEWLTTSFDFLTGPNLSMTIAPKQRVRLSCDVRMDRFRDIGDVLFENILWYRFFNDNHELGDFAGIGLGLKRDELAFDLSATEENFALQYYSAFIKLDLSLLTVSGGPTFGSVERYGDTQKRELANGWFGDIQCLYQF